MARHRAQRQTLNDRLEQRQRIEREERQKRFRTGFRGLWDRLTGLHSRIKTLNEREACESFVRDRAEKEQLIVQHLEQRGGLDAIQNREHNEQQHQKRELQQDVQVYEGMLSDLRNQRLKEYSRERQSRHASRAPQDRNRGRSFDR
ncbi:MAG: hypothetical protein ACREX4_22465 [Gammaproteobacteria bacterium]